MSNPLVSICMPVYNGEKTLDATLASIVASEYQNIEIIISDDGSTDETPEICRRWMQKDNRISYYPMQKNSGAVANFNCTFHLAKGKYFTWVAQDDRRHPAYIRKCVQEIEKDEGVVLCQSKIALVLHDVDNLLKYVNITPLVGLAKPVDRFLTAYRTGEEIACVAFYALIRTDTARKTRLWKNYLGSDIAFFNELSLYGKFAEVPEVLFWYFGREKVRTPEQHYKFLNPQNHYPKFYLPFFVMAYNQAYSVLRSPLGSWKKFQALTGLFFIESGVILRKILFYGMGKVFGTMVAKKVFQIINLKIPVPLPT